MKVLSAELAFRAIVHTNVQGPVVARAKYERVNSASPFSSSGGTMGVPKEDTHAVAHGSWVTGSASVTTSEMPPLPISQSPVSTHGVGSSVSNVNRLMTVVLTL
jgi:hypothetical protein